MLTALLRCHLLDVVTEGCRGHGPIHLLASSTADIRSRWDSHALSWARPGLPAQCNLAGPIHHFRSAILSAWQGKVAAHQCARSEFRGGPLLDVPGTLQLLGPTHVRKRDKALSWLVGFGMGSLERSWGTACAMPPLWWF